MPFIRSLLLVLLLTVTVATDVSAQNWNTCTQWGSTQFGYYGIRNNTWGSSNPGASWQCMWASRGSNWFSFGTEAGHSDGTGQVKGYPQVVRGWSIGDGFSLSNNHQLGQKVPNIWEAKARWSFASPNSGRHISLIDIYLHWWHTPGNNTLPALNIQLVPHVQDSTGWLLNTNNLSGYSIGRRLIGGIQYEAWLDWDHPDGAADWLMHVRPVNFTKNATHDIKGILDWGREYFIVNDNMYLTSIQVGWELIDGGSGFSTSQYWTRVNGN